VIAVPAFSAKDQHGMDFNFTNGVEILPVATEMACGKVRQPQARAF
jgi:hypothetical protein